MTSTDFSHVAHAPVSSNVPALRRLNAVLSELNFTFDGMETLLGTEALAAIMRDQNVPAKVRTEHLLASPRASQQHLRLAHCIDFFLLGAPKTEAELNLTFGYDVAPQLPELGLAHHHGQQLRASVDLRPHAADDGTEIWVASDLAAHQRPGVLHADHVLGIGHASRSLAQFIERTPRARALDIGTGCGVQTFHLLAHCGHVTATDISARALAFTRFNLLLNAEALKLNPENLEARVSLRLGSLLEPVAGESFDLVISNPPFVITPRTDIESEEARFTYRDGGLAGDAIVSTLIEQIPAVLTPGGTAQMLGNWEIPATGNAEESDDLAWTNRLKEWVARSGDTTEAWAIQRETLSPEQYAETWLRDASQNRDPELYERSYRDYLQDFSSRGVEAIGFGMIWLRRPRNPQLESTARLHRFEEITYPIQQPIAPFITQSVSIFDAVAPLTDSELAEQHLVVAEDVTEERHATPGAEHPGVILLRQGAGLRRTVLESTATAGFVSACDGELNVGQIASALHMLLEWEGEAERAELLEHVRNLMLKGFLRIYPAN